jgi:hypothetical protein
MFAAMRFRLPSVLAVVALVPACGGHDGDTCSPCMSCTDQNQEVPCGCVELDALQSACGVAENAACQCVSYCIDETGVGCHGDVVCAGSNGTCPTGCDEQGGACAIA